MPYAPYDTGLDAFCDMLQSIVAMMLIYRIEIFFKTCCFIVKHGLPVFDTCCSFCHSVLNGTTNIVLDVIDIRVWPQLWLCDFMFPPQKCPHWSNRWAIQRLQNKRFYKYLDCTSGRHSLFY